MPKKATPKATYRRQRTTTSREDAVTRELAQLLVDSPIPPEEILFNLGLYMPSRILARALFMDDLYRRILTVHGEVMEFGTRWGQNAALFVSLRGIHEPFNRHRKVVAFDTFEGLRGVQAKDGRSSFMRNGALAVSPRYDEHLERVLELKEKLDPVPHFKKYEVRKGLAQEQLAAYLHEHPETIVALAFFDMDLYEPTRDCLKLLKERLTRGSVIAFDELNEPESPGETVALHEVFGLDRIRLRRHPRVARVSYFVVD